MKKHIVAIVALSVLAFGAFAKTYNLPKEDALASINIPESWSVEADDESLTALSKDETIEFSMEILDEDQLEGAVEESLGYLKKNKVDVKTKSSEKTMGEINGLGTTCYSMDGKDEDGPCTISLMFVRLSKEKLVSILYWAPEKIEAAQLEDIKKIVNSIKKK